LTFLGEWTSIYQLFWCSPGVQGFDPSPYHTFYFCLWYAPTKIAGPIPIFAGEKAACWAVFNPTYIGLNPHFFIITYLSGRKPLFKKNDVYIYISLIYHPVVKHSKFTIFMICSTETSIYSGSFSYSHVWFPEGIINWWLYSILSSKIPLHPCRIPLDPSKIL
jgi:hypothetical protein